MFHHHIYFFSKIFAEVKEKFNVEQALDPSNENGVPHFECITPLRLLLASEKYPEKWASEVKDLESHNKERAKKPQWEVDKVNVVLYIRNQLKLTR